MYAQISLCLVLVAGAFAHGASMGNGWNSNGWGNMGGGMVNQHMGGGGMNLLGNLLGMGGNMGWMGQQGGHGNMGWGQMGGGQMGGGQMNWGGHHMGGTMGGLGGPMGGQPLITMVLRMFMMALMQNMGGNYGGGNMGGGNRGDDDSISQDDMEKLEKMMKWEFAMEVAHISETYKNYNAKMKNFKDAVDALCLGVDAYMAYGKQLNLNETQEMEEQKMNEDGYALIEAIGEIKGRDKQIEQMVNYITEDEDIFGRAFFLVASKVCSAGEEYMHAYEQWDDLQKDMKSGSSDSSSSKSESSSHSEPSSESESGDK